MNRQDKDVHDPLSRQAFDSITFNAVGRASEINTYPAYALSHSTGNSGWSVGIVQWDFGQPGRGHKVEELLERYQAWATEDARFNETELASLDSRLKLRGQTGNALTADERQRLDSYLRSDDGRTFVEDLNREQIDYKWRRIGEPLAGIPWLQVLGETDPRQATEIITMASKLFNQNETRGARLRDHLQHNELTSQGVHDWIGSTGIQGLNPAARNAIVSGRDKALAGANLLNDLQHGDSPLSARWRDVIRRGDAGLSQGFEFNPDLQLFDAMLRHPERGSLLLQHVAGDGDPPAIIIRGINARARSEMAEVHAGPAMGVVIATTRHAEYALQNATWSVRHPAPVVRPRDIPDYTDGFRSPAPLPLHPSAEAVRSKIKALYEQHDLPLPESQLEQTAALIQRNSTRAGAGEVTQVMFSTDRRTGQPDPGGNLIAWHGDPRDPATIWTATPLYPSSLQPRQDAGHEVGNPTPHPPSIERPGHSGPSIA